MLAYQEYGDAASPAVLIVHGLFGTGRNWGVIAKRLADTYRVVTVDLRNHGSSPHTDTHNYPDLADDLLEVIIEVGAPLHVVGHSMGGKAAMTLALHNPGTVRRLVVADIAPVLYTHSQIPFIEAMKAVDLTHVSRRSEAEAQLADHGVEPALCSFFTQSLDIAGKRWRLNLETLEREMPQIMGFPDLDATFEAPTLFLSGAESDYVRPEHRDKIKGLFPQTYFAKLKNAGHWLHADQPRAFEAAVRSFLANSD